MIDGIRPELTDVLESMCNLVPSHSAEIPVYPQEVLRIERVNGKRQSSSKTVLVPQYGNFLLRQGNVIQTLSPFKKLIRRFQENASLKHAFRLSNEDLEMVKGLLEGYLAPLADHILKSTNSEGEQKWNTDLDSALQKLDSYVENDNYAVRFSAPLFNFKCTLLELEIADGIVVRHVSDSDLESYMNSGGPTWRSSDFFTSPHPWPEFELHKTVWQPRETPTLPFMMMNGGQVQKSFEDILKALRLTNPGGIGVRLQNL